MGQAAVECVLHRQIDKSRVTLTQSLRHGRPLCCQVVGQLLDEAAPGGGFMSLGIVRAHGLRERGSA